MRIRCATTNKGKLNEFRMAAGHFGFPGIAIEPMEDMDRIPPCVENGETFEANAVNKALHFSGWTDEPVFADDSGLEVDALGGAPGVYSARYSEQATDAANNRLLVANLRGVEDRTARFVCVIALAQGGKLLGTFRGAVEGRIIDEERGPNGFGYDPLFFHPPFGCTFGEAESARKMSVSHRGQALRAMLTFCRQGSLAGRPPAGGESKAPNR